MKPILGKAIYYKELGSPNVDRAAIITDVRENPNKSGVYQIMAFVISPQLTSFTDWLDQGQEANQWDHPQLEMPIPYNPTPITPPPASPNTPLPISPIV